MSWEEIASSPRDPLVTIGAHTVNHPMLAKLPAEAVRSEMDLSRAVIEAALGVRPQHLCLSVWRSAARPGPREFEIAAELGFKTAVTTQPGVLFREHAEHLTALPRISLNGEYQQLRYVRVLLSGSATAHVERLRAASRRRELVAATDSERDRRRKKSSFQLRSPVVGRPWSVVCSCRSSTAPAASPADPAEAGDDIVERGRDGAFADGAELARAPSPAAPTPTTSTSSAMAPISLRSADMEHAVTATIARHCRSGCDYMVRAVPAMTGRDMTATTNADDLRHARDPALALCCRGAGVRRWCSSAARRG